MMRLTPKSTVALRSRETPVQFLLGHGHRPVDGRLADGGEGDVALVPLLGDVALELDRHLRLARGRKGIDEGEGGSEEPEAGDGLHGGCGGKGDGQERKAKESGGKEREREAGAVQKVALRAYLAVAVSEDTERGDQCG